jgi:amidohydrolase
LSFKENTTAAKITELLKSYGIDEIYEGCALTGVVAVIRGGEAGPCIGLRADIDALPIVETSEVEYKSQNYGTMHACGHDGHITGLLAAAKVLNAERATLKGSVKLLFQPAEEGYGGAKVMVDEGCLEEGRFGPRVDSVYGIHLWSCKPRLRIIHFPLTCSLISPQYTTYT